MTVIAECETCGHKFEMELKPTEVYICPKCKTRYNAIEVMNDEENKTLSQNLDDAMSIENALKQRLEEKDKQIAELEKSVETLTKVINNVHTVRIKQLTKENAELRNNGFTVSAMTEQQLKVALEKGEQLEKENKKAKEIIKKLKALYFSPVVTKDDVKKQDEILTEVEQFLSEVKE